eukprot:CAMPEP_0195525952 /NCGR_PEP_ID=MMETSP0794_2-20130614/26690_1 /TAXON_ID=515487 /ORGANISM="Stephanopyxis turris, Strain CCMP 815" /LENGTH=295 /DNA_ID=CAMNT_0040656537 /DNA_START=77 /DNA_END=961 /DNA_ORIENTATION=-
MVENFTQLFFDATVTHTDFDGNHLEHGPAVHFVCSSTVISTNELRQGLLSKAGLDESKYHNIHMKLGGVELVTGDILVEDGEATLSYFRGCVAHHDVLTSTKPDRLAFTVTVTTIAPVTELEDVTMFAALTVHENDRRNDREHSSSWRVEILKLDTTAGEYIRTYWDKGKQLREGGTELMTAAEAVSDAIVHSKPAGANDRGKFTVEERKAVFHEFDMQNGRMVDIAMHIADCNGQEHLVWNKGTHYDDTRWNQVYYRVDPDNVPTLWITHNEVSPYCSGVCVPAEAQDLFDRRW